MEKAAPPADDGDRLRVEGNQLLDHGHWMPHWMAPWMEATAV
jgi:hypothetical protein